MSGIVLRDYQEEFVAAVTDAMERGVRKQLGVLPTGGGKTIVFSHLVQLLASDAPALILAHRDELLEQAREKLLTVAPELEMSVGLVKGGANDVGAPIVIGSVQTLSRPNRLAQLPPKFKIVIVDEGHHATAESYQRIIDHVDADLVLYVTATPKRADGKSLEDIADELVFARSLQWMIEQGYLCPPRGKRIAVDVDLAKVKKSHGDFQSEALAAALEEAGTPAEVLLGYEQHAEGRKTIVFAPTVEMAHHMAQVFQGAGHACEAVDGDTPADERKAILDRFHTGQTTILCNVNVLTEGYDEPSVECIILAAPTRSEARYTQIVGRGLRLYPGKTDCLVLDVVGTTDDVDIQSLPALFGLESLLDGENVLDAIKREEGERIAAKQRAAGAREGEAAAQRERRRRNEESIRFFSRERMNWTMVGDKWTIPLNAEHTIVLWPQTGEHFDVLLVTDRKDKETKKREQTFRFLHRGFDLGYAMGTAEEAIRKYGSRILADSKAAWREDEVTKGQRWNLERLGLPIPETKGEASDLLNQAFLADQIERIERAILEREAAGHDVELERVA